LSEIFGAVVGTHGGCVRMFNLPTLRPLYGNRYIACGHVWTLHALDHLLRPAPLLVFLLLLPS
jgi:hypothetical protein